MRKLFYVFCLLLIVQSGYSQTHYDQALGIKFPGGVSITYKNFVTGSNNVEAMATIWNKGCRFVGLYEFNFYPFEGVDGLSWFVGPGAHIGFWNKDYKDNYDSRIDIGIDGIIGLDYKFPGVPINLSLDWQPSIALIGDPGFDPVYGGLAVRFTF